MRKNDLILGVGVIAAALVMLLIMNLAGGQPEGTASDYQVCIRVDGKVWGTWPLEEDRTIEVNLDSGYNRVRMEAGEVYMEEADCPDGYCMHQGPLSGGIETIVCLPHKLVVEVISEQETASEENIDSVAK